MVRTGMAVATARVAALITASTSVAAGPARLAVAASSDVQVFVLAGSVTKDSRRFISVWTRPAIHHLRGRDTACSSR